MIVFVDTSALYSVLDRDEQSHAKAARTWNELLDSDATLLTTNYVLLETAALVQHRLGLAAVRVLHDDVEPVLSVEWVPEESHQRGVESILIAARRNLSLVDCISFHTMRHRQATTAFCFDQHFREQGFTLVP